MKREEGVGADNISVVNYLRIEGGENDTIPSPSKYAPSPQPRYNVVVLSAWV